MAETLKHLDVCSKEQCEETIDKIFKLKKLWLNVFYKELNREIPFYTLGVASTYAFGNRYLHSFDYYQKAQKLNQTLLEEFSDFYELLKKALEEHLKEEVAFDTKIALPGFHLFLYDPLFAKPVAKAHFDLQYQNIDFREKKSVDLENSLSVTVALKLPKTGGGIRFWEFHHDQSKNSPFMIFENLKSSYYDYEVGKAVIHSGHYFHRIEPSKTMKEDEMRITLQAHGLKVDGKWVFYW